MSKKYICILAIAIMCIVAGCGKNGKDTYTEQGYNAVTNQKYAVALELFDQAIMSGEPGELAYRGKGLAFMGAGEYEKAISAFDSSLACADLFVGDLEYDTNYYKAVCYYKLGRYDEAISVYDAIADLRQKDSNTFFLRGNMKLYLHNLDGAMEDFDKAVSLDKKNYGLYIDIYAAMIGHNYQNEAYKYLDVVLNANVDDIGPYDKGRLCYYQGQYSQACKFLENAKNNGKQNSVELISLLGDCYIKDGNYEFAAAIYNTYVDSNPDAVVYNELGLCYVKQGDYESALKAFHAGIEMKENVICMQSLLLNEIVCYEYLRDYATAKDKLVEYLNIYPSNEMLEKEKAFLATR